MTKVFHFANKTPFPLRDGGCVAISSILKSLLNSTKVESVLEIDGLPKVKILPKIEVFHFTLSTHKHPFEYQNYPINWLQHMKVDSAEINTKTNLFEAIYYLIKNKSYNVIRFYDEQAEEKIRQILDKEQFDVAIFESIYTLPYLHLFKEKNIKAIVRAHNVEHRIWETLGGNSKHPLKRWYFKKLAKQLKKYELEVYQKVDGIISITEEDALFFQRFEPKILTTAIPPIINPENIKTDYNLSDFYFLGAMDWRPNEEGIDWFLEKVIPNGLKGTTFHLAGKNLKKENYQIKNVVNEGEVDNALDFINQHGICVIPLLSGGGLKIKLLENMALGKPIITTSEGVRGVGVNHEKEVLIADDPNEFREQMYRLNMDRALREKLGTQAKTFIQNNYSEEKLTRRLIAFIRDI